MEAPQIIMLVIYGLNLLIGAYQHGKPKEGNYSFWYSFIGVLLSAALLYCGGFFG